MKQFCVVLLRKPEQYMFCNAQLRGGIIINKNKNFGQSKQLFIYVANREGGVKSKFQFGEFWNPMGGSIVKKCPIFLLLSDPILKKKKKNT